jgi:hypothetical protein
LLPGRDALPFELPPDRERPLAAFFAALLPDLVPAPLEVAPLPAFFALPPEEERFFEDRAVSAFVLRVEDADFEAGRLGAFFVKPAVRAFTPRAEEADLGAERPGEAFLAELAGRASVPPPEEAGVGAGRLDAAFLAEAGALAAPPPPELLEVKRSAVSLGSPVSGPREEAALDVVVGLGWLASDRGSSVAGSPITAAAASAAASFTRCTIEPAVWLTL